MRIVVFNAKHKLDLDHEILYFDYTVPTDVITKHIKAFKPDLIIEEEKNDGVSRYSEIYNAFPKVLKAWWMIDAHTNLIDHIVYAKQFDYVFCAQSWFEPIISREVLAKVFWLPLCHTQTLTEYKEMMDKSVKKDIGLSFIGNIRPIHVERGRYVAMLLKIYPGFIARQAPYENTLKYLRRSSVTFNCSLNNDLNFRVWEAIACGAMVLTDIVSDVFKINGLSKHLTLYDKLQPNWDSTIYSLSTDLQQFIEGNHTLTHRMNQLLEMIETNKQYEY